MACPVLPDEFDVAASFFTRCRGSSNLLSCRCGDVSTCCRNQSPDFRRYSGKDGDPFCLPLHTAEVDLEGRVRPALLHHFPLVVVLWSLASLVRKNGFIVFRRL